MRFLPILIMMLLSAAVFAQHKSVLPVTGFEKAVQTPGVQLLDVRTPEEFREGYIRGAINADWQNEKEFTKQVSKLDKSKPVYLYCLSGVRSGRAADWLAENGFHEIINLEGGIKAWKAASKPIVGH